MAFPTAIYPQASDDLVESSKFLKPDITNKKEVPLITDDSSNDNETITLDESNLPQFTTDQDIICKFIKDHYQVSKNSDIPGIGLSEFQLHFKTHFGLFSLPVRLRGNMRKTMTAMSINIARMSNGYNLMGVERLVE